MALKLKSFLVLALFSLVWRLAAAKDAYLSPCEEYPTDSQRWLFKFDRLGHETLIRIMSNPEWCLMFDWWNSTTVDVELCDPQPPSPEGYAARAWNLSDDGTIRTLFDKSQSCLIGGLSGNKPTLEVGNCSEATDNSVILWNIYENGTISTNASTSNFSNLCLTVNLTSPTPGPGPSMGQNVVIYTCRDDNENQKWSALPGNDSMIHLLKNTSMCLAAEGEFPGSHGPNIIIMPCNNTAENQIFYYNETTKYIMAKADLECLPMEDLGAGNTTATCRCLNITHSTPKPEPENNIEAWQCGASNNGTETWTYNTTQNQYQSCGLCLTVSTLTF